MNVRKALIMGIDRDAIIKAVLLGHAKPIASFQSELSFGYDPSLKPLPFDLAKAKQMLQQANVPAGAPVRIDFRGNDATFREVAQAAAGYPPGARPQASLCSRTSLRFCSTTSSRTARPARPGISPGAAGLSITTTMPT